MTGPSLAVHPPVLHGVPVTWSVTVDGSPAEAGLPVGVSPGPVQVTLHAGFTAEWVHAEANVRFTIDVRDSSATSVVVRLPLLGR